MLQPEPACLAIADISGYTGYLAGVELDHAQDILADLMTTVVAALRPRFKLAKLEGDAAFVYVFTPTVDSALMQDAIEATYFAFRRRLRDIRQSSRCACNACLMIPSLDLKFVVHHGPVARQKMAGREELVGREVILVHRLLKNSVARVVGNRAYALFTEACIAKEGVDPATYGLRPHQEEIDIIGPVRCWIADLEEAWQRADRAAGIEVGLAQSDYVGAIEVPVSREIAWDHLTLPAAQVLWMDLTGMIETTAGTTRRGVGTVNHCMHGKETILQEIIGWRPFDFFTTRSVMPVPGAPKILLTDASIDLPDGGTRIEVRLQAPKPREREAFAQIRGMVVHMIDHGLRELSALLAGQATTADAASAAPSLPESRGRFLSEPVATSAGTT